MPDILPTVVEEDISDDSGIVIEDHLGFSYKIRTDRNVARFIKWFLLSMNLFTAVLFLLTCTIFINVVLVDAIKLMYGQNEAKNDYILSENKKQLCFNYTLI